MAGTTHYRFQFTADSGEDWQVNFCDTTYSGSTHTTVYPDSSGFILNYEGPTEGEYTPIIPSTVTVALILDANVRALAASILAGTQSQFCIVIKKYISSAWVRQWMGPILNEGLVKPDAANGVDTMIFTATDGFGVLRDIKYDNFDINTLSRANFKGLIHNALLELMPSEAFSYQVDSLQFTTASIWYEDTMDSSVISDVNYADPIANTWVNQSAFITVDDYGVANGMTWYDILSAVLSSANLQISQSNGTFLIIQANTYSQTQTRAWHYDWQNGDYISTELIDLHNTLDRLEGCSFSYILPVKEVTTEYEYKQGIYGNNLLPVNVDEGADYSMGVSEQGSEISFAGSIELKFTSDTESNGEFIAVYRFAITCGTYHLLKNSSNALYWSASGGYIYLRDTGSVFSTVVGTVISISNFSFKTPPLPTEGDALTYRWEFVQYESVLIPGTAIVIPGTNTTVIDDVEGTHRASINTGISMQGTQLFKAHVSNGAKSTYELENSILGDGANKYSAGALFIEKAGDIYESNVWSIYSDIGVLTMPINSLRCKEWLSIRRNTIEVFEFTGVGEPNFHKGFILDSKKYVILTMTWDCSNNKYSGTAMYINPVRTSITVDTPLTSQDQSQSSTSQGGSSGTTPTAPSLNPIDDILDWDGTKYKPYAAKQAGVSIYEFDGSAGEIPDNPDLYAINAAFNAYLFRSSLSDTVYSIMKDNYLAFTYDDFEAIEILDRFGTLFIQSANTNTGDYMPVKIGDGTNNTVIAGNGHLTFEGTATCFDSIPVTGLSMRLGGSNDPTLSAVGSTTKIFAFSGSTANEMFFIAPIPHSYKHGSDIEARIHWCPMTSPASTLNVKWGLDYQWHNHNGTFLGTDTTTSVTAATGTTGFKHLIDTFGTITGTSKEISSILICRVYRLPADAADTYTGAAGLFSVEFVYEIDSIGSNTASTK